MRHVLIYKPKTIVKGILRNTFTLLNSAWNLPDSVCDNLII